MTKTAKVDVYELVTDRIITALEAGVIPWRKTWSGGSKAAQNYHTKVVYQGINALLANLSPYGTPYFLTFKQAKYLGGYVKQGAKSIPIVFWKPYFVDADERPISEEKASLIQDAQKRFVLKYYSIFNIEDVEGIDFQIPSTPLNTFDPIEKCEEMINQIPNPPKLISEEQPHAFYSPHKDTIFMPLIGQFETPENYYATLMHEEIHATGHVSRLARPEVIDAVAYGSDPYAQEELLAEIGSAFLCQELGISTPKLFTNQAAYIGGWLKKLKDDKRFVLQAANQAQKAVTYILNQ